MRDRLELQAYLEQILGSRRVYFQPPENLKMEYPCIRYKLKNIDVEHADDMPYLKHKSYELIYIDADPDNQMIDTLSDLPMCRFDRTYAADGLHCYVYTIFY